jgi:hypothetical protein
MHVFIIIFVSVPLSEKWHTFTKRKTLQLHLLKYRPAIHYGISANSGLHGKW